MSPLVLKRVIRLGVYSSSGILVVVGLLSCVTSSPYPEKETYIKKTSFNRKVEIKLPSDFVEIVGDATALSEKMKLLGCEDARISQENDGRTFFTNCSEKPTSLTINGFKHIEKPTEGSDGTIIFQPDSEDIFSKEIFLSKNITPTESGGYLVYYIDNGTQHKCQVLEKKDKTFSFHYKCIGKELSFQSTILKRCSFSGELSLQKIEQQTPGLPLTRTDCSVDLVSPFKLSQSPTPECELQNDTTLRCNLSGDDINSPTKTFTLNWGRGWESTNITVDIKQRSHNIPADKFKPRWPFKKKWWAQQRSYYQNGIPSCSQQSPKYAIKTITYGSYNSQKKTFASLDDGGRLPTLEKWFSGWGLPNAINVTVEQHAQSGKTANGYKQTADVSWQLSEVGGNTQWTLSDPRFNLEETSISVRLTAGDQALQYKNHAVHQYDDMTACRNNQGGQQKGYFSSYSTLRVKPCAYLKLYDERNAQPVSRCIQANRYNQVYFEPRSCGKKRKLIVISTGNGLEKYGGRTIRNTIIEVLQQKAGKKIPFTVVTIQPGRALSEELLTCEEMGDVEPTEARKLVSDKLKVLNFQANDLRALRDLEFVHQIYQPENLGSVFYLVDKRSVPSIDQVDDIKDLAIPYGWNRKGIPLMVLTTGMCKIWEQAGAQCFLLKTKKVKQKVKKVLNSFLAQ